VESTAEDGRESRTEGNALLSRLRLIEDQPLESRAAAFGQVYDELQTVLEGADVSPRNA
jgi:hypothetical protein